MTRSIVTVDPSRPGRRPLSARWPRAASRAAAVVAGATWLLGIVTVASALLPPDRARLRLLTELLPYQAADAAAAVAAALGVLLLYLAGGLRRRKHRAWVAAVVVTAVVGVSHLAKGLDVEEAGASAVVLALLLGCRHEFGAEADPGGRRLAVRRFVQLVLLGTALGMLLLQAYSAQLVGRPSLRTQVHEVLLGLLGVTGPVGFASDRTADLVGSTLLGFGLLTAFVTAYFALRPAEPVALLDPSDEQRLRALLDRHGRRDSLGYFALRRDKSVVFSPSGKAAVTYRVVHGVLLASGDPVGDPEAWPGAIEATLRLARRYAWTPAVIGCGERGATVWTRSGLGAYELGDEAVLDAAGVQPGRAADARDPAGRRPGAAGRGDRDGPAGPRRPAGRAGRAGRGRGRLARRRRRARLLDGAVPARRPRRPRLRAGHRPAAGRVAVRAAALRPVGTGRAVARPHAPGPGRRQRDQRVHGRRAGRRRRRARRDPALAELRGRCGRRWRTASGSAPARWRDCGARRCCSPPAGGRSRRCTASTPSSSPAGSRATSATSPAGSCPGSRWRRWRRRRSWSRPASSGGRCGAVSEASGRRGSWARGRHRRAAPRPAPHRPGRGRRWRPPAGAGRRRRPRTPRWWRRDLVRRTGSRPR